jgi:hypothetical protein
MGMGGVSLRQEADTGLGSESRVVDSERVASKASALYGERLKNDHDRLRSDRYILSESTGILSEALPLPKVRKYLQVGLRTGTLSTPYTIPSSYYTPYPHHTIHHTLVTPLTISILCMGYLYYVWAIYTIIYVWAIYTMYGLLCMGY